MKDLKNCKSIRVNNRLIFVHDDVTIREMKEACPIFFGNNRPNEIQTRFRGCLIVNRTEEREGFKYRIYGFDVLRKQMPCLSGQSDNINDLTDAKAFINNIIERHDDEPLTMTTEVVELVVPVKVSMIVFRDENGNRQSCEIDQVIQVGADPERRIDPSNYLGAIKQIIENDAVRMIPCHATPFVTTSSE